MRIAVLNEPGRFDLVQEPEPAIGPDDVLLRVAACGVCASELETFQGRPAATALPCIPATR